MSGKQSPKRGNMEINEIISDIKETLATQVWVTKDVQQYLSLLIDELVNDTFIK